MVTKHFEVGGLGFIENSSIFNLMKIERKKREPDQTNAIVTYLRKVSTAYRKLESSLVEALVERLQPHVFKEGETILR